MNTAEVWLVIGPIGVAAFGGVLAMEIKRLRGQMDQILENQKEMAVQIAKLEAKLK